MVLQNETMREFKVTLWLYASVRLDALYRRENRKPALEGAIINTADQSVALAIGEVLL